LAAYHTKCIDPWLTKNRRVCPVCKAKVTLPGMPESDDSDSDHDRRARSSQHRHDDANERTQLLPPSRSSRSRSRNLGRLLIEARVEPTASSSRGQPNYSATASSSSRYQPLDDTLSQPGPSTSAPVVSELSSSSQRTDRTGRSKRKRSNRNVQVVAAEIAPLIAPAQLSINCDSDVERPPRSSTMESIDSDQPAIIAIQSGATSSASSSSKRSSKRPSVDHIV